MKTVTFFGEVGRWNWFEKSPRTLPIENHLYFIFREDIIILCASGTAVVGNLSFMLDLEAVGIFGPPFKPNNAGNVLRTKSDAGYYPTNAEAGLSPPLSANIESGAGLESGSSSQNRFQCSLVHIPYADISLPYACRVSKCRCCSRGPVPDVLICTVSFMLTIKI